MKHAYTVAEIRSAEAALMATLPPGTLMQRAAAGLATACADLLGRVYGARIVVVAGTGGNGGDALWAGARLAKRGAMVTAIGLDPTGLHAEGLAALHAAGGRLVPPTGYERAIARADLVLDGIVGIGGKPGLRGDAVAVLDLVRAAGVPIVAVDLPSGIDPDTGEAPDRHVEATVTVTFGAYKVAHFVDPGSAASGAVHLVDIGLGDHLPGAPAVSVLQPVDVRSRYPVPRRESHKYTRGVLGVLAGSREYTGAAVLVVGGALGGSLGMVRYVGAEESTSLVRHHWPEAVVGWGRVQAWVVGSGLGAEARRAADVAGVLAEGVPVLIDADGLRHLPESFTTPALLTPHEGELARILGVTRDEVAARRLHHAREAAERWQATVLLKGATTVIAAPDGRTRVNTVGTPYVATAGSGDVLSGLCGSLLAAGLDPFEAAGVGCFLHETAGVLASDGAPITATELLQALPAAARSVFASAADAEAPVP